MEEQMKFAITDRSRGNRLVGFYSEEQLTQLEEEGIKFDARLYRKYTAQEYNRQQGHIAEIQAVMSTTGTWLNLKIYKLKDLEGIHISGVNNFIFMGEI